MIRKGTYIREPDGAMLLYYSSWYYIDALRALKRDTAKDDFSVVNDKEELKKYSSLKPGEYEEIE